MTNMRDEFYMKRALKLALKARGYVSPNPMVGAVIVKNGAIIGEGYHRRFGENHAEVNAIDSASASLKGSTFYITLEPCTHYGKTPPCVDRVIAAEPARVVIGVRDPNPVVSGKGIHILKEAGIEVTEGVCEEACTHLNETFFKYMKTGFPFVTVKFAQTLDGRIATASGHSQWISSPSSLAYAHRLRAWHDAVLVGAGTVLNDDPALTVRLVKGRNPLRVVIDPLLSVSTKARVVHEQDKAKTLVITTSACDKRKRSVLHNMGIETVILSENERGLIDFHDILAELGKRKISSVLVEGGSEIITTCMRDKIPDRLVIITAPKILGKGLAAVGDLGAERIDDAVMLRYEKISRKGTDIIITAVIDKMEQ